MDAIVGYTGFVGSNLLQFIKFDHFYNSLNISEMIDKVYDKVYFCGIPAVKYYANKYPEEDFKTIETIKNIIRTIKCNKFILVSTIDVYENPNDDMFEFNLNEDYECDYRNNHAYGSNRYLFELFVKETFVDYHIVRLGSLFGKGLKKNIIYDLINNNQIQNIPLNSFFQWYYLNRLGNDINIIINNNIRTCNLFSEPVLTRHIVELFCKIYSPSNEFAIEYLNANPKQIIYNVKTKYCSSFDSQINDYIMDANTVLYDLENYLKYEKINKTNLCVSNICTNNLNQTQFASLLKLYGIRNVQIAPTKLVTWDDFIEIETKLEIYKKNNITPYSFQSIFYSLNHLNIFNEENEVMFCHFKNVIDVALINDIQILVFGCPTNRKILNQMQTETNNERFIDFFKKIGEYCLTKNITICIENNSKKYGCNFINTIEECAYFVRQIDMPNIKMMVDLGNAIMENDTWMFLTKHIDIIANIDVSHECMKSFEQLHESNHIFKYILKHLNYNRMINLEMLIKSEPAEELEILTKSLYNFVTTYGE